MKNRKRHGALLGLLATAALGVLAFAASAQALTPQFVYKNTSGTEVAVLLATIAANQLGTGTLSIPGLNVEINCTGFTVQAGSEINTATDAKGKLLYEGCTALEELAPLGELTGCELVSNHEGDNKHHITAEALILPTELNDGSYAILAEKIEAAVLTKPGLGCILPKTTKIVGELCIKIANNETTEVELISSRTIQGLCKERTTLEGTEGSGVKDKLLFGAQEAFVTASADVKLTGAHNGYSLGVLLK